MEKTGSQDDLQKFLDGVETTFIFAWQLYLQKEFSIPGVQLNDWQNEILRVR